MMRLPLWIAIAVLAPVSIAQADTITYSYSGAPFSVWFNSGCPPQCDVTGSITFSESLPANLPWATSLPIQPLSYSFTDGLNLFSDTNSTFKDAYGDAPCGSTACVGTGANGSIAYWSFAFMNTNGLELVITGLPVGGGLSGHDSTTINTAFGLNTQAGSSAPGAWSGPVSNPTAPVPEPSTLLLTCLGVTIAIFLRRSQTEILNSQSRTGPI